MAVDFNAIATALAVRFSSTVVTAPSGELNIQQATSDLPVAITTEPTVLVFPPASVNLSYGPSLRKGIALYPVRFYIYKPVRDMPRNMVLINKWLGSLYAILPQTLAHLGLDYVTHADVQNIAAGLILKYSDIEYHGLELTVAVHFQEGFTATA